MGVSPETPLAGGDAELEVIELDLLTEGIRRHYDVDLATYSRPQVRRRLRQVVSEAGLGSLSGLQDRVLHDRRELEGLLASLTSDPVPLFEDESFFTAFRKEVVPWLRTHPSLRLWQAGCGSPSDLYTLAIVLHDEGLLSRARIYVTDSSELVLARAQAGLSALPDETAQRRYEACGGRMALSQHFRRHGFAWQLAPALQERVFYTQHHLSQERSFNEFHAVLCRHTILHFHRSHRARIHDLLFESLAPHGYLALGRKESVRGTPHENAYEEIPGAGKLYRRMT
jgi:chemotaxis protein methyltransferase CheR